MTSEDPAAAARVAGVTVAMLALISDPCEWHQPTHENANCSSQSKTTSGIPTFGPLSTQQADFSLQSRRVLAWSAR